MIRPCHTCKRQTEQTQVIEGRVLKWICTRCRSIAWVGLLKAPARPAPANNTTKQ